MIYRNNRNQVVARMNEGKEDFILRKAVDGTEHMLRSPKGWAADKQIIDKAIADGAKEIRILDKKSTIVYRVTIEVFMEKKLARVLNYGSYGPQYALPLKYWEIKDPKQMSLTDSK